MVFTTLCLAQLGNALAIRSDRYTLLELGLFSNRPLVWAILLVMMLSALPLLVPSGAILASAQRTYMDNTPLLLEDWEEDVEELTSMGTTLKTEAQPGTIVPVRLQSRVTEVGTLELWCLERDGPGRWKLEFEVREKPEG